MHSIIRGWKIKGPIMVTDMYGILINKNDWTTYILPTSSNAYIFQKWHHYCNVIMFRLERFVKKKKIEKNVASFELNCWSPSLTPASFEHILVERGILFLVAFCSPFHQQHSNIRIVGRSLPLSVTVNVWWLPNFGPEYLWYRFMYSSASCRVTVTVTDALQFSPLLGCLTLLP